MKNIIARNITNLRGRIAEACGKYNRDVDDITIVAVTKTRPAAVIRTVVAAGLTEVGESRIQEAEPKIAEIGRLARMHLVGHLQTNKARKAVALFDVIQSVDSFKLAEEISRHATTLDRRPECLVQVNCSEERQKYGVTPDQCLDLIEAACRLPNIRVTGLMTIGPNTDDEAKIRGAFALCRRLFEEARDRVGKDFEALSMGMSDDFPLAIAEGSTMIRVGAALFGLRETEVDTV